MRKLRTRVRLFFVACMLLIGQPDRNGWEIGALLLVTGGLLHALAAAHLDKNRTLTISGPYRFVRNPFYVADFFRDLGVLLACHFAFSLEALAVWIVGLGYFLIMYGVVIPRRVGEREEPRLEAQFGEAYRRYCRAVPRFFPRLWPIAASPGAGFRFATLRRNRELPRLLALLVLGGLMYFRREAFYHDFVLAKVFDDPWQILLFASFPLVLLASKLHVDALSRWLRA